MCGVYSCVVKKKKKTVEVENKTLECPRGRIRRAVNFLLFRLRGYYLRLKLEAVTYELNMIFPPIRFDDYQQHTMISVKTNVKII